MKATTTRRLLVSVALGGLCAALLSSPPAHADSQEFLNDLYDHGWSSRGGDVGLVDNGYRVCQMLNTATGDVVARYVYENTGTSVSRQDAMEFVILAVEDLCPQQDHRTNRGMAA